MMSEQSSNWEEQWSTLLTRCHGKEVTANAAFKTSLLEKLKQKTAESVDAPDQMDNACDANWQKLFVAAYIPCHPDEAFKDTLLNRLKDRQANVVSVMEPETEGREDGALRVLLSKSYHPVEPRPEFQTRLLGNLKDRQRTTTIIRRQSRKRTLFLSGASGVAAAAIALLLSLSPAAVVESAGNSDSKGVLTLSIPPLADASDALLADGVQSVSSGHFTPGVSAPDSYDKNMDGFRVVPASFEATPAAFGGYRVTDAFAGAALPQAIKASRNIEMRSAEGWQAIESTNSATVASGTAFRSLGAMGHMQFDDGSIISMSADSVIAATSEGLWPQQGFMLVSVPAQAENRFRLHFPERDLALEPGTDLAIQVESPSLYAEGGAPAPMVMVVDRADAPGGLALARGKAGVGPLLAKQLYRLDNYITPDLPGRTMCDTECNDLDKMFKLETKVESGYPMASFTGGFMHDRPIGASATTVISPAGYSKKGERWVADSYSGENVIRIQYLSDEYFGLANQRRDLALALALGSTVVIDGGEGLFYEIYK